jgi:hypothetical protein
MSLAKNRAQAAFLGMDGGSAVKHILVFQNVTGLLPVLL